MSKTHRFKVPNPNAPQRGRLDADPTIPHVNRSKYRRARSAGWDEYYAELNDDIAEFDEFLSDFQEE